MRANVVLSRDSSSFQVAAAAQSMAAPALRCRGGHHFLWSSPLQQENSVKRRRSSHGD
jgi:hypothetical protein